MKKQNKADKVKGKPAKKDLLVSIEKVRDLEKVTGGHGCPFSVNPGP